MDLAEVYDGLHGQLQMWFQRRIELESVVVVLVVEIERSMFEAQSDWSLSDDGCGSRRRRRLAPLWAGGKGVTGRSGVWPWESCKPEKEASHVSMILWYEATMGR